MPVTYGADRPTQASVCYIWSRRDPSREVHRCCLCKPYVGGTECVPSPICDVCVLVFVVYCVLYVCGFVQTLYQFQANAEK